MPTQAGNAIARERLHALVTGVNLLSLTRPGGPRSLSGALKHAAKQAH